MKEKLQKIILFHYFFVLLKYHKCCKSFQFWAGNRQFSTQKYIFFVFFFLIPYKFSIFVAILPFGIHLLITQYKKQIWMFRLHLTT